MTIDVQQQRIDLAASDIEVHGGNLASVFAAHEARPSSPPQADRSGWIFVTLLVTCIASMLFASACVIANWPKSAQVEAEARP